MEEYKNSQMKTYSFKLIIRQQKINKYSIPSRIRKKSNKILDKTNVIN